MSNRLLPLAAALTLAASAALAGEAGFAPVAAIHGAKTVGAMAFETRGLATSRTEVLHQGGFASAGAARWTRTPGSAEVQAQAF